MSEGGGNGQGSGSAPPPVQIDYPTRYVFKAVGPAGGVRARMLQLIQAVVGPVGDAAVSTRLSGAGKYEAVSVEVTLRSEEERRQVYAAFHIALSVEKVFAWYV